MLNRVVHEVTTGTKQLSKEHRLDKTEYVTRTVGFLNIYDMIYLLTAIGLSPGGSITVHIYTQTIHRKTQITTEQHT